MKKFLIAFLFTAFIFVGSNISLPLYAVDLGDLIYTLDDPNAYGTSAYDAFGNSIAVYEDYVIVGAFQEYDDGGYYSGKVYIFNSETGNLLHTLDNPNAYDTSAGDQFGTTVSISGTYAIVGTPNEKDSGGSASGKAYIFDVISGNLLHTLDNPNAYGTSASDQFGFSVSISGNYAIVGARYEDEAGYANSGKVYIFDVISGNLIYTLDNPNAYGTPANDYFGSAVSISGNHAIVGALVEDDIGGANSGKAYIFDVTTWDLLYTLDNPNAFGTSAGDTFGHAVSISGNYAIVGAYQEDEVGYLSSGKAYIFDITTGNLVYTLNNPNAYGTPANDNFGFSVSISGDHAIVGVYNEDDIGGTGSGKAYIFDVTTGDLLKTLNNPNPFGTSASDNFGFSVATNGKYFVAGAHQEDETGQTNAGKAYIFKGLSLYTISFESNGGSAVADITQYEGTPVTPPDDPTKDGFVFAGWYEDVELTIEYTFTTMTENITLYAKWDKIASGDGLTNNFAFIFIAILLYFALIFLRFKTGARVWNLFAVGILIFLITQFTGSIPMIVVLIGVIIYQLYDTFKGGT